MLFPIDHGNSAMKTVNFVFPSGLIDNPIRPPVDTEMLEYDGKFWTLSGQRISYMRDKTKDERYWILTLFAIAKELGVPVKLAGVGEGLDDLKPFDAKDYVEAII